MQDYEDIKNEILNFRTEEKHLKILKRKTPLNSEVFFYKIMDSFTSMSGFVSLNDTKEDILGIFGDVIPSEMESTPLYHIWLNDMVKMCKIFCNFVLEDKISFWIGTKRSCKRYHVDMVPFRLLVTYSGQGTELLPDHAANRIAFDEGKSNEEIIKDKSALKFLDQWDIAVFRGGKKGILHRTPDSALNGSKSLLMRLDNFSFLKEINIINNVA